MGCTSSTGGTGGKNITPGTVQRRKSQFESQTSNSNLRRKGSSSGGYKVDENGNVSLVLGQGPSQTPSSAQPPRRPSEAPAKARKPSLGGASVRCKRCGEGVGKTEEARDSKGLIFHVACLKCVECGVKLALREQASVSATRMTSSQYCLDEKSKRCFCDKHAPTVDRAQRKNSIKGQDINEKAVDDKELLKVSSSRRNLNKEAKEALEESGGFSAELKCARCGTVITKAHKMTTSGMMRYHEVCPSKEEVAKSDKSIKHFLDKLPERFAGVLESPDPSSSGGLCKSTFLYVRDQAAHKDALKQAASGSRQVSVVYLPDSEARDAGPKALVFSPDVNFFLRQYPQANFTFEPTFDGQAQEKLVPSLRSSTLTVPKQAYANGIMHGLEAVFSYDEKQKQVTSTRLILKFERPFGADSSTGTDNGGSIRGGVLRRRDTNNRSMSRFDSGASETNASSNRNAPSHRSDPPSSSTTADPTSSSSSSTESSSSRKDRSLSRFDSSNNSNNTPPLDASALVEAAGKDLALPKPKTSNPGFANKPSPSTPPGVPPNKPPPALPKNKPQVNQIDVEMV